MLDWEPDDGQPGEEKSAEVIVRNSILGDNLKGDDFSSKIHEYLEYCKTVSRGEYPPTAKPDVHLKRYGELEAQIQTVGQLPTEARLDDYNKQQAFQVVVFKACETFITISIDLIMSLVTEAEPHLQYWRNFSNSPRALVNRCMIYHYIEPKYYEKKTPLDQMVCESLDELQRFRTQLICQAGKFLRWYWRLKAVGDFSNQNVGQQLEGFLKETWDFVDQDPEMEGAAEFYMPWQVPKLLELLIDIVGKARSRFENIHRSIHESRKPHHLSRYFVFYAAGFVSALTSCVLGLGLKSTIKTSWGHDWTWGLKLLEDLISRPARGLYYSIFVSPKRSKLDKSVLKLERGQLETMIRNYPVDPLTVSEAQHHKRAKELDLSLVMDTYAKDVKDMRMTNLAYMPRLLQGLLIQMQAAKVQKYEMVEQMDEIIEANDVLMCMLSLVPGSVMTYGAYLGMKRLWLGKSLDMHTYKYRFRRLILKLHSLIMSLKDPSSKEAEKIIGDVILTCEKLRILMHHAVQSSACIYQIKDMNLLDEDLSLFLDFEYDVNHRLRQLARMERFYL